MAAVLIIEPDKILTATYEAALSKSGHHVLTAANAQEAITVLDEQRVDAIILELQLLGHSGVEFLYEFRSYDEWNDIPVIVNSFTPGSSASLVANSLKTLGVEKHLYKPTSTLTDLSLAVEQVLERHYHEN